MSLLEAVSRAQYLSVDQGPRAEIEIKNDNWRFSVYWGWRNSDFFGCRFLFSISLDKAASDDRPPIFINRWRYYTLACGIRPWDIDDSLWWKGVRTWWSYWAYLRRNPTWVLIRGVIREL